MTKTRESHENMRKWLAARVVLGVGHRDLHIRNELGEAFEMSPFPIFWVKKDRNRQNLWVWSCSKIDGNHLKTQTIEALLTKNHKIILKRLVGPQNFVFCVFCSSFHFIFWHSLSFAKYKILTLSDSLICLSLLSQSQPTYQTWKKLRMDPLPSSSENRTLRT